MDEFWILILVLFFATNSLDKAESVKLELKTFDEIFGEGWWDKGEADDLKTPAPTNFGQNVHQQIDRQNTQIGQIEPNSTDQNPPLTESDHSDNAKNNEEQNEIKEITNEKIAENEQKRKIIDKFNAIKDEFEQKGKYSAKERNQIEQKIAKHLKVNRSKIYKWKKEFGLRQTKTKNERQNLVEKFDQMKADLKRAGFKNSYKQEIDETVAKELGLSLATIYNWKRELGQIGANYSDDEKLEIVKKFMQMESEHSGEDKKSCKEIVERFGVNVGTINQWKKEFGLSLKNPKIERKNLVDKFDQMKAELKRAGLKNSYPNQINETVAKELGLSFMTIYRWKRKLGQTKRNKYPHSEQKKLMKRYYQIKDQNPKISDEKIAELLKIGSATLIRWKKQFKRQQLHPNSVDRHSVEVNAAANIQEIRKVFE